MSSLHSSNNFFNIDSLSSVNLDEEEHIEVEGVGEGEGLGEGLTKEDEEYIDENIKKLKLEINKENEEGEKKKKITGPKVDLKTIPKNKIMTKVIHDGKTHPIKDDDDYDGFFQLSHIVNALTTDEEKTQGFIDFSNSDNKTLVETLKSDKKMLVVVPGNQNYELAGGTFMHSAQALCLPDNERQNEGPWKINFKNPKDPNLHNLELTKDSKYYLAKYYKTKAEDEEIKKLDLPCFYCVGNQYRKVKGKSKEENDKDFAEQLQKKIQGIFNILSTLIENEKYGLEGKTIYFPGISNGSFAGDYGKEQANKRNAEYIYEYLMLNSDFINKCKEHHVQFVFSPAIQKELDEIMKTEGITLTQVTEVKKNGSEFTLKYSSLDGKAQFNRSLTDSEAPAFVVGLWKRNEYLKNKTNNPPPVPPKEVPPQEFPPKEVPPQEFPPKEVPLQEFPHFKLPPVEGPEPLKFEPRKKTDKPEEEDRKKKDKKKKDKKNDKKNKTEQKEDSMDKYLKELFSKNNTLFDDDEKEEKKEDKKTKNNNNSMLPMMMLMMQMTNGDESEKQNNNNTTQMMQIMQMMMNGDFANKDPMEKMMLMMQMMNGSGVGEKTNNDNQSNNMMQIMQMMMNGDFADKDPMAKMMLMMQMMNGVDGEKKENDKKEKNIKGFSIDGNGNKNDIKAIDSDTNNFSLDDINDMANIRSFF